jgi:hypothetical protein
MKREGTGSEFFWASTLYDPLMLPRQAAASGEESLVAEIEVQVPDTLPRLKPETADGCTMTNEQVQGMIDRAHMLAAQLEAGTLRLDRIDPNAAEDWTQAVYNLVHLDSDAIPLNEYKGPHRGGVY